MFPLWWRGHNNNHDNVDGTVVVTIAIAKDHSMGRSSFDECRAPDGRRPSDQANRLGTASSPLSCYRQRPPSPFIIIITQHKILAVIAITKKMLSGEFL